MNENLKDSVKAYYTAKQLRQEKMQQLLEQADLVDDNSQQTAHFGFLNFLTGSPERHPWLFAGLTALLVITLMSLYQYSDNSRSFRANVIEEIALNHNKQLEPDFSLSDMGLLTQKMGKLGFSLDKQIPDNGAELFKVLGGRYCSIQGGIAAQIKLQDSQGNVLTMYQTRLTPKLKSMHEGSYKIDGVNVQYGNQGDIFWGLAENI